MKKNILLLLFAGLFLTALESCSSTKSAVLPTPSTETNNTKEVQVVVHDTVFHTEKDSSFYKSYLECVHGKVQLANTPPTQTKGNHLQPPKVKLENNQLTVDCESEAQRLFAQWKETYTKEHQTKTITIPYSVVQPLSWWQTTQIYAGRLLFLLLLCTALGYGIRAYLNKV